MLHSLKEFIRYFWLADSKYKVHSPFVYNLAIALFDNRAHSFDEIEKIRSQLLKDRTNLEVVDYGAGSKFQHSAQRSIQSIARTAVSNKRKCITLKSIVQLLRPSSILELGTSLGISTAYISRTLETSNIITIEGSHGIAAVATNVFEALNLNNVTQLVDAIDMALPQLIENGDKFDLIYADGNHTEAATTRYFEWFLELTNKDSVILLDDIYWSKGMTSAWNQIKAHPRVYKTIDLYTFGLVFFSDDFKEKQHHRIIDHKFKPLQSGFFN